MYFQKMGKCDERNSLLNKSSPELVEDVKMLTRPGIRVDHTYYLFLL